MKDNTKEIEEREVLFVDINKPGILVHGIDTISPEILKKVLTEGLKPRNDQENAKQGFTVVPEWVSLSMVGWGGYRYTSTAFLWGANNRSFNRSLSLVLDPNYVRTHAAEFKAVGASFDPTNPDGTLLNGLLYEAVEITHYGNVFPDEIVTKFVPPEAIVGIITNSRFINFIKEDLKKDFPDRKIVIYDIEGNPQY